MAELGQIFAGTATEKSARHPMIRSRGQKWSFMGIRGDRYGKFTSGSPRSRDRRGYHINPQHRSGVGPTRAFWKHLKTTWWSRVLAIRAASIRVLRAPCAHPPASETNLTGPAAASGQVSCRCRHWEVHHTAYDSDVLNTQLLSQGGKIPNTAEGFRFALSVPTSRSDAFV